MAAKGTAAAKCEGDGRGNQTTSASYTSSPASAQARERILCILRVAYREACDEQDAAAENVVLIAAIGRAVESGAVDPAYALAKAVEAGLIALDDEAAP